MMNIKLHINFANGNKIKVPEMWKKADALCSGKLMYVANIFLKIHRKKKQFKEQESVHLGWWYFYFGKFKRYTSVPKIKQRKSQLNRIS